MIQPRPEQLQALGTPVPCKPGPPVAAHGAPAGAGVANAATASSDASRRVGPSVVVIDPNKTAWLGIELIDRKKRPVPGAAWDVLLPNGETVSGILDRNGKTRLEGIDPGECTVTFPALDQREFL